MNATDLAIDESGAPKRIAQLDQQQRHARMFNLFLAEKYRQHDNREDRALWERFYDNKQHTNEELQVLEDRGQMPVTFNEVAPMIDWMIGTERRQKIDFTVTPRNALDEAAMKDAETKKALLKYLSDTNNSPFERSQAFGDMAKSGLGWLEIAARGDSTDSPLYVRHQPWRFMWHDSFAPRHDLGDSRYVFRLKVIDMDLAAAFFPGKTMELLKAQDNDDGFGGLFATTGSAGDSMIGDVIPDGDRLLNSSITAPMSFYNPRNRVPILEAWCYEPWVGAKQRKSASTFDRGPLRMRVTLMTEFDILYEDWSPYIHNRFPFIPRWAYRDKATGLPYSPIMRMVSKQRALNHTMSRAAWEMSVNQIVMEKDAYDKETMSLAEIQREAASPDGIVVLKSGGLAKFQQRRGIENAQSHVQMADRLLMSMRNESGITPENMGQKSNVVAGVAIGKRQDQGSLLTTELFDNELLAQQLEGEILLSAAEQYVESELSFTIPGDRSQYAQHQINQRAPDGSVLNDITQRAAKFVMGEQQWRQAAGQAAFEQMMDLMGKLAPMAPQVVIPMLDIIFEYADIPNKQVLLQRIRTVTGQPGPDGKISPEQQQAMAEKAAVAKQQFDLQMAQLQADVQAAQAKGQSLTAVAMKTKLDALYVAAQAAQVLTMAPAIAPVADMLAIDAGFQNESGEAPIGGPVPIQAQPQQQPAAPMGGPLVGHEAGMNTNRPDGVQQGVLQ